MIWTLLEPPEYDHRLLKFNPLNGIQTYIPKEVTKWIKKQKWKNGIQHRNIILKTQVIIIECMRKIWAKSQNNVDSK